MHFCIQSDLPSLLNVDLHHCECQVDTIMAETSGSISEFQGELISDKYFDNVAAEMNELLQDAGMIRIGASLS